MDLKRLQSFYLVAKYGSLLRAANHLKVTVPTLSVQLKKFEADLHTKLFHHLPNRLLLTDQGHAFLKEASRIFDAVERAELSLSDDTKGLAGKLSISLGNDMSKFFAPKIASFIRRHPHVGITILSRHSPETLSLVVGGAVDLGIGRFERIPRGINREKLLENGVLLIFPANHTLSRKARLEISDIAPFRIITLTRNSQTRRIIDSVLRRNRIEPENILEVGNCETAINYVRLGLGLGIVHDICVTGEAKRNLRSVDMSKVFGKTDVTLIYRPRSILIPAHRAFLEVFINSSRIR